MRVFRPAALSAHYPAFRTVTALKRTAEIVPVNEVHGAAHTEAAKGKMICTNKDRAEKPAMPVCPARIFEKKNVSL